jgi:5-methylcytosine-specific restriction endonuclease McrA
MRGDTNAKPVVKLCRDCGESRPEMFAERLRTRCKACQKAYMRRWYDANKDKVRTKGKAYREANAERIRAQKRAYRQANIEQARARDAAYAAAHKEEARAYSAAYRATHREKLREYHAQWTRDNPDRVAEYQRNGADRSRAYGKARRMADPAAKAAADRAYRASHPEQCKARSASYYRENSDRIKANNAAYAKDDRKRTRKYKTKYREANRDTLRAKNREWSAANPIKNVMKQQHRLARLRAAEGSHTAEEWLALLISCGGLCVWCGSGKNIHRDHVIPIVRGGTDYIDNIVPACRSCNSSKGKNLVEEWFSE